MKKKILLSTLIMFGFIGLVGVSLVSAHGGFGWIGNFDPEKFAERQQTMFQEQADILGISIDKIKNYWAEGKNLKEIAEAEGITDEQLQEKMKQAREKNMNKQLQALVDKGIIMQEQADKRLNFEKERMTGGKFSRGMGKGFMRGLLVDFILLNVKIIKARTKAPQPFGTMEPAKVLWIISSRVF